MPPAQLHIEETCSLYMFNPWNRVWLLGGHITLGHSSVSAAASLPSLFALIVWHHCGAGLQPAWPIHLKSSQSSCVPISAGSMWLFDAAISKQSSWCLCLSHVSLWLLVCNITCIWRSGCWCISQSSAFLLSPDSRPDDDVGHQPEVI